MRSAGGILAGVLGCICAPAWAADVDSREDPIQRIKQLAAEAFVEQAKAKLPSTLKDVLQLTYIEPNASQDGGFGVAYDWSARRDTGDEPDAKPGSHFAFSKLGYDVAIKGAYAFSDAENNQNLSEVRAAVHLARADFGKIEFHDANVGELFQRCLEHIPAATDSADQRLAVKGEYDACIEKYDIAQLVNNATSYYYSLDFHGGMEADQNYSNRHALFGIDGVLASEPSAALQNLNIVDWPFRLLRNAFSPESRYVAQFPSVRVSFERLDAKDDETRAALTDELTYNRASAEVAFNTQVASTAAGPVRFNFSYRYFDEFSAPDAIKQADLDRFEYFTAMLLFPARLLPFPSSEKYELFVRYTSGQLPFDPDSDHAYELGISTNFEWLGQLLQR